jgi:hypothetical protein
LIVTDEEKLCYKESREIKESFPQQADLFTY